MTGTLARIHVSPGDRVAGGGILFVVEAMKMEYAVRAPRDVTVAEVRGTEGGSVTVNEAVVVFGEDR
jgi:biotin carboxyl carrier protein